MSPAVRTLILPALALVVATSLGASPASASTPAPSPATTPASGESVTEWQVRDRLEDVSLNRSRDRTRHPGLARALDIRSARFSLSDRGLIAVVRVNRVVHRPQVTQILTLVATGKAAGSRTRSLAVAAFVDGPVVGANSAGDSCRGVRFRTHRKPARLRIQVPARCLPDSLKQISVSNFAELRGADFGTDQLNTRVPA